MHAEHPVVQVKRLFLLLLHPRHRLRGHAVLDVLAGRFLFEVRKLPRCDIRARRPGPRMMRQIQIKSLLQRRIRLRSEMPFAEVRRGIARVLQRFRERAVFGLQSCHRLGLDGLLIGRCLLACRCLQHDLRHVAVRHRDARACRALSREQSRTRGRAQRTGRIRPSEGHAATGEACDVRCLVIRRVAVKRRVTPAQVVGENNNDVRLRRESG